MSCRWLVVVAWFLGALGQGCGRDPLPERPVGNAAVVVKPRPRVVFDEVHDSQGRPIEVQVVVAKTPEETKRGLMFVDKLEAGRGMLFVMPQQRIQTFWMKNTYISLDMIFIDESMKVAGLVEEAEPLTLEPRYVEAPSRYVLEVPGGWSRRVGLRRGLSVRFVDVPR